MFTFLKPTKEKIVLSIVGLIVWILISLLINFIINSVPICFQPPSSDEIDPGIIIGERLTPICSSVQYILSMIMIIPVVTGVPVAMLTDSLLPPYSFLLLALGAFPSMYFFVSLVLIVQGRKLKF